MMRFNNVKLLLVYSILYVSFCIAIIVFIGIDFDFRHRLFQNLYGLFGFISIITWFLLLFAFLQYDGTKNNGWNKLCYELYLFKDKKTNGRLSRDVIFPTLFWSIFIFFCAPVLSIVAKTEHSHPLGMVVSTHFRCGKGVKRGLKNGALPFNID